MTENTQPPSVSESFVCLIQDKVEGPFDLIELAAQLRYSKIDADTPIRRVEETDWRPFRDLPDFATIQEISIEVIARHLEKKEQGTLSSSLPKKSLSASWIILAGVGSLVIDGLFLSAEKPRKLAQTIVKDTWVTTEDDHFSIECPIPLKSVDTPNPKIIEYLGTMPGVVFSLYYGHIPGQMPDVPHKDLGLICANGAREIVLKFHGQISSEKEIDTTMGQGYEIWFTTLQENTTESGRAIVLVGENNVFCLYVVAYPGKFSDENMDRFFTSLKIR